MRHPRVDRPVEALGGCTATSNQLLRASRHLEALLRTQPETALTSPGDLYHLLGLAQQTLASLHHSLDHLQNWLDQHQARGRLAVDRGPFSGEPDAAVATTILALREAQHAATKLQDALMRAQLTMTELYDAGPPTRPH